MATHHNPFAQSPHYFQLAFDLPEGAAMHVENAFDDVALAASAFEVDEMLGRWRCELLFVAPPDMAEMTRRVALLAALVGVKTPAIATATLAQQDWLSLVARNFPPLSIGRFFVHGAHVTARPPIASLPIQVEAGAAFGSGEHATTRGCLEALSYLRQRMSCRRVLDMGSGSGILAIAAARLWNAEILAVDIDPVAVQVAAGNARINHTQHRVRSAVSDGYRSAVVKRFVPCDVVIANILARPLIAFAPALASSLRPGGFAILSGLLASQERMVFVAHRLCGLRLVKRFPHEGWCTLLLQRF